jgi:hypothetical protein
MTPVQFKFIPFTQTILSELLNSSDSNNSLYIFPNEAGKRAAIREFQNKWSFQNIQFLTMEELKEALFLTDKPLLKEEKRTLVFYASLSDQDKSFFKIGNYFQCIELAHNFFDLWEEFNEELLPDELDRQRLQNFDADLLSWQTLTFERISSMKANYRAFVKAHDFDDVIFTTQLKNLDTSQFDHFQSVHFVNQFYYTKLERQILENFCKRDKTVTLYYQLDEHLVHKDNLSIQDFSLKDLRHGQTEKIDILECSNEFNMLRGLVQQVHAQKLRHVVNFSASRDPYARYLSPARFNLGRTQNMTATSIYQFLQQCFALLSSLIFEPERRTLLLPIQALYDAFLDSTIAAYFSADQKHIIDSLAYLISRDEKFIDLDGDFFISHKQAKSDDLRALFTFLKNLLQIDSIAAFIHFIDSDPGIRINNILTETEKSSTTLRETFYRALADFQAIDKIGIVADWSSLFTNHRLAPQAQTAAGFFQLFLDYLKPRSVLLNTAPADQPRVEFVDLQDSRNLSYTNVAIMNVVEKQIPHPRKTPFLFTEKQRQALGLKTYDDIKLREKYYFLRLVLTTPQITLITQKNIEQNIDVSSFVEEIRLFFQRDKISTFRITQDEYSRIFEHILTPDQNYAAPSQRILDEKFYRFDFQLDRDFPQRQLNLSYYSLSGLLGNAFTFFIKNVIRLDERPKEAGSDYSPMLIGNVAHECLNQLWRDILDEHILSPAINFADISPQLIQKTLQSVLKRDRFYYSSPHNHAQVYFEEILLPRMVYGIEQFFRYLDRLNLSNMALDIFPEQEGMMSRDEYIPFIVSDKINFAINIGGRADLRIEAKDKSFHYIFDYKTGGSNREQLILYELYYYLQEHPELTEQVSSFFYQVLDAQGTELREFNSRTPKATVIEKFETNVRDQLNGLWKTGYGLPEQKARLGDMAAISRSDLYTTVFKPSQNNLF